MKRIFASLLLACVFAFGAAGAAHAEDYYLNEALQALQGDNHVYVSASVKDIDTGAIDAARHGKDIAVVVLPADAAATHGDASGFLGELASNTNHETILVVIGNDFAGGSRVLVAGKASQIADASESHGGSLTSRIVEAVGNLSNAPLKETSTGTTTTTPPQDTGFNPVPVVGGGLAILLVIVVVWRVLTQRRKSAENEPPTVKFVNSPTNVREQLREVLALRQRINPYNEALREAGLTGNDVIAAVTNIGRYVEAYFKRAKPEPDGTYKVADDIATYIAKLKEVLQGFIAVQDEPEFYYEPEQKMIERAKATQACANYMLTQVRTVNEAQEFDLGAAVKVLQASELRSIRA